MRVEYSVTFEFESRPALTHRGTVAASTGATCVARATRAAQKALRPVGWSGGDPVVDQKLTRRGLIRNI
jgi:hypothetical protein